MKKLSSILLIIGCQLLAGSFSLKAQYSNLLDFNDFNGIYPVGDLILSDSILYGMTPYGGANDFGCVFSIDTSGKRYTDLHDFNDTNGSIPYGSLTLSGNTLYGMTREGGTHDSGCVFSMRANGSSYRILHYFTDSGGACPQGNLMLSGSKLYGMTSEGGRYDSGCVFSLDTIGNGYADLHDFRDTNGHPYGSLILLNGKLYGMTSCGKYEVPGHSGDSIIHDSGCIFSIDTNGNNYRVLHNFKGPDGAYPFGALLLLKDRFYGMTSAGGANQMGCVFSIDTDGSGYSDIYNFSGTSDGAYPHGSLICDANDILYGMTGHGGADDSGCVFYMDTTGSIYRDFFDMHDTNGIYPYGSLTISGNLLYGMTEYGGAYNVGVIFRADTNANTNAGINRLSMVSSQWSVYPNPNNGIFTVSLGHPVRQLAGSASQTITEVFNVLGEQVYSATLNEVQGDNNINISNQPNGIYLYRVITESGRLVGSGKIVIQK